MGQWNSSGTRVAPVFEELLTIDGTGESWLSRLLRLAEPGLPMLPKIGILQDWGWGDAERGLPPPRSLLRWLVEHAGALDRDALDKCPPQVRRLRELLIAGDEETRSEALRLLQRETIPSRIWYILEGITYPDVWLRTERALIVIEGKRTEPDITRRTTWMPVRHQMLRHIDAAWEQRGRRTVFHAISPVVPLVAALAYRPRA